VREILDLRTVGIALTVVIVWAIIVVISGAGENWFPYRWNFENTGQFGDSFGSLSAIMASLAALSALATFRSTRDEIERAKQNDRARVKQMRDERREIQRRQRIEDQRLAKAEFERTFFSLLSTFNALVADTDVINQSKQHPQQGRDAFKTILDIFERYRQTQDDSSSYKRTALRFQNDLNHYFRFLYHLIVFVDDQRGISAYFYVRLIRALLSDAELSLLALNCIYGEGLEKFKPLVEKYALLHNLSDHYRDVLKLSDKFEPGAFEIHP
jgi:hypothetical protein